MKRYLTLGMLILGLLSLASCAYRGNPFPKSDLTEEHWMNSVDTNPNAWARGADRWFLTGDPTMAEEANASAPDSAAISTMLVKVSNFNNIKIEGPYQVQIFGAMDSNSVYVYGPNADVRQVAVEVRGNTLCIHTVKDAAYSRTTNRVIIRIGVVNLNSLVHRGSGRVEGRQVRSNNLAIVSSGNGNMYLAGNMNVKRITQTGTGCVNVFGAITPVLDIDTTNSGDVNVSGNVGIRCIKHHGKNNINIIGANTDDLKINADGSGKIGINGRANVREIVVKERVNVYIYSSVSDHIYAYLSGDARVGIAGNSTELYVDATGSSRFMGRYLCTMSAYVRAHDQAHINVTAATKIYAAATQNGSVYFFGTPDLLSQFLRDNGTVIPIWFDGQRSCAVPRTVYKDSVVVTPQPERYHWKNRRLMNAKGEGSLNK